MCSSYGSLAAYGLQTASVANRGGTDAHTISAGAWDVGRLMGGTPTCWWPSKMGDAGSTPQCCSMHPTNPPHGVRMDPHPAVQQHWGGSTSHLGWTPQIPVPTAACKGECPPGVVS